ncbi:MAG: hypothetical protein KAT09_02250 [Candidatus Aegiribacteria sp.]|nr:hypothetical protein [Candidatus Aegiribacteria sp.]
MVRLTYLHSGYTIPLKKLSVLILLFLFHSLNASDTLFMDDFSGNLSQNWIMFGDPLPRILDSLGLPPPCFNNNGDSMAGSGVITREVFEIGEGLGIECDMYLSCDKRGTWVTASLYFITPDYINDRSQSGYTIATLAFSYSGEMDWTSPHLQGVLTFNCFHDQENKSSIQLYHQNDMLDGWHRYRMEITEHSMVNYFIDDSLYCTSTVSVPDTAEHVRIQLGNRSSVWGIALHDNLIVYRP